MTKLTMTKLRERRAWSKAELARRARLDAGLLCKIEASRVRPYPRELARLAEALGVSADHAAALLEADVEGAQAETP
jgi:transcriptional regulator with XRE-family HTH domain